MFDGEWRGGSGGRDPSPAELLDGVLIVANEDVAVSLSISQE